MGKAQSKRSVDITTETKKCTEGGEEVTGKLEKIEDTDQKQVNGDAISQEKSDAAIGEKKSAPDETDIDKDMATEKSAVEAVATAAADDISDPTTTETSPKEDANASATPDTIVKEGEEISPLVDEGSNKKQKKEKVKKKWSFRSISFGKKDKQKPAKTESTENPPIAVSNENEAATTPEEITEANKTAEEAVNDLSQIDDKTADEENINVEKTKNGIASESEEQNMNGQKTPTPTEEEQNQIINTAADSVSDLNTINAVILPNSSNEDTANKNPIENNTSHEKVNTIVSNGISNVENNVEAHEEDEAKTTAPTEEMVTSVPAVDSSEEKVYQNGTNGVEALDELTTANKTLQIEDMPNAKDLKDNAVAAEIKTQDFPVTSE